MSGIYVHIPFCHKRCVYCDFYLVTNLNLITEYVSALKKEIRLSSSYYKDKEFDTIYFGGGTPSILSPIQISDIISDFKSNFNISEDSEITVEANPEDLRAVEVSELRHAGVNRLSIGIQSFVDEELKFLTREHTSDEAEELLKRVGDVFEDYSIDIIYSLPEQTQGDIEFSLEKALELKAPHISAYALTYEEKTQLYKMMEKGVVIKNSEDIESDMFEFVSAKLREYGYEHYEISSFAKPGYEAKHNSKYWQYENYLGFGPSAHSFFDNKRWNNIKKVKEYGILLEDSVLPQENVTEISTDEQKFEYIMTALRSKGVYLNKYKNMFGEDFIQKNGTSVEKMLKGEFAEILDGRFKLTLKGFRLADEIIVKYFG